MKNKVVALVLALVLVVVVAVSLYAWHKVANHTCPLCGGTISAVEMVLHDGNTAYRYVCENSVFHVVELPIRLY